MRPADVRNARPAGLNAGGFTEEQQAFAQGHLRILSGLYGCLKPFDLIRPYRLDMGTKLANPGGKDLYQFWGEDIAQQLEAELDASAGTGRKTIINCASQEYFKSVVRPALSADTDVITCAFPGPSVYAKKARGMLCRFIAEHALEDREGVKAFEGYGADRYSFSEAQSSEREFVFLRGAAGGGGGGSGAKTAEKAKAAPKAKPKAKAKVEPGAEPNKAAGKRAAPAAEAKPKPAAAAAGAAAASASKRPRRACAL